MRVVHEDMRAELERAGIPLSHEMPGPERLEAIMAAGGMPLVLISSYRIYGERSPPWMVMTGCDTRYVYMHDPCVDTAEGEVLADCTNMPVRRRDSAAMARYGRAQLCAAVVGMALKAARLIGDGLYGVDLKETPAGVRVIEVNDNPSLDAGVEDSVLGDALYDSVIASFIRRLEE